MLRQAAAAGSTVRGLLAIAGHPLEHKTRGNALESSCHCLHKVYRGIYKHQTYYHPLLINLWSQQVAQAQLQASVPPESARLLGATLPSPFPFPLPPHACYQRTRCLLPLFCMLSFPHRACLHTLELTPTSGKCLTL